MSERDGGAVSKREWLAAHAPAEEISEMVPLDAAGGAALLGMAPGDYQASRDYPRILAICRYQWADAMLRASREGGHDG